MRTCLRLQAFVVWRWRAADGFRGSAGGGFGAPGAVLLVLDEGEADVQGADVEEDGHGDMQEAEQHHQLARSVEEVKAERRLGRGHRGLAFGCGCGCVWVDSLTPHANCSRGPPSLRWNVTTRAERRNRHRRRRRRGAAPRRRLTCDAVTLGRRRVSFSPRGASRTRGRRQKGASSRPLLPNQIKGRPNRPGTISR